MVDTTDYEGGKAPTQALKQVFGRRSTDSELCKLAAKSGLTSVENFAMLGDTVSSAKDTLAIIMNGKLSDQEAEKQVQLLDVDFEGGMLLAVAFREGPEKA